MKKLTIIVTKQWFDMIASGVKKEDYRDISKFWIRRLLIDVETKFMVFDYDQLIKMIIEKSENVSYSFDDDYDAVEVVHGYAKDRPKVLLQFEGIDIGKPNPDWCGGMNFPSEVFRIKMGDIINN